MKIPADYLWKQSNEGDIFGVLHSTQNITLDDSGKIQLSKKGFTYFDSTDDSDLGQPLALTYFDDTYYLLADELFRFDLLGGGLTQNTSGSRPTFSDNGDMIVVYGKLYITYDNNLANITTGEAWSTGLESLTSGVPHPMEVFDSQTTYKLAIGNGNTVSLLDSSHNNSTSVLTLPVEHEITTMRYRNGYLYVGTRHLNGGEAKVYIWDGDGNNANYEVTTGASWVFSMTQYQSSVAFVTDKGQLLYVNGTVAEELAALPVYYKPDIVWQDSNGLAQGKVFNRGMVSDGKNIIISVDGEIDSGFMPEMKSGIWIYDPTVGLYHRASPSIDGFVSDTSLSLANNTITTSATHNLKTGDCVVFDTTSGLVGVDTGVKYYVDVQSATSFKLSLSRDALERGKYLTITGTPAVGDDLIYVPNTDYFNTRNTASSGPVCLTTIEDSQLAPWVSTFIWASRHSSQSGTTIYGVFGLTDSWNIGSFETQRIYSQNVTQNWKSAYAFIDGILTSTEKAIIKYRTKHKEISQQMRGVWLSANQLNSDNTTADEDDFSTIDIGDEIVFVDGKQRGYSAHVTAISESSGTYTLTLDESIGTLNDISYFYVTNYRKAGEYTKDRVEEGYLKGNITEKGSWIQLKVELRGFQPSIAQIELTNEVNKSAV